MSEKFLNLIIGKLAGKISGELICFIVSVLPILELRGGLLAASILQVPLVRALVICIIGNLLPVPMVLLGVEWLICQLEKWKLTSKFALWLRNKADKNKGKIEKAGFWGLVLFVGIPLPGTGAWTGSLVAAMLHMPRRKSFLAVTLGVLLASVIMTVISYGIPWFIRLVA